MPWSLPRRLRRSAVGRIALLALATSCRDASAPRPSLVVTPPSLDFDRPGGHEIRIENAGGGTLNWTAWTDAPWWVTIYRASGVAPTTVSVGVSTDGMHAGVHSASIHVVADGAANSPQTVAVTVTIPSVTGHWSGVQSGISLDVDLVEVDDSVTGTGNLVASTIFSPVTVTGTHVQPNVTLTLSMPSYAPTVYTATLSSANAMVGTLTGSGFYRYPLSLTRFTSRAGAAR